jgi:Pyruvate/2-oxoacid:ferredoxin oxidoreductase delta subunit
MWPQFMAALTAIVVAAIGASATYYFTEQSRLAAERDEREGERYEQLLRSLNGFYSGMQDPVKKDEFELQLRLCWLYCSDALIQSATRLLDATANDAMCGNHRCTEEETTARGKEFVTVMRKQLFAETELTEADVRFYSASK